MKKSLIVFIAAILIGISIFTVTTYNKSTSKANLVIKNTNKSNTPVNKSEEVKPNSIKTKAIDFKLKDLDGKEVSLSELKGKKVFLNFWATWCPPCRSEMPEIETLFQETKD
ncbi:MAG: TlpA family protein disulfide reductase, partial [Clostridiaceae bacterium]|nr:TlpA family protein disulfide reductase [Clostridiaceae bacterium]